MFCKKFDKQAARDRLTSYLDRLYGYACSLTRDPESAKDLMQTTAVKALTAKKTPVEEPAYRAWLFIIMRNAYRDELRHKTQDTLSLDQIEESSEDGNKIDHHSVSSTEHVLITQLTVQSSLEQLGHDHREIITLVDIMGFSYRECADILDIPVGTIMSRISRARKCLLEIMKQGSLAPAGQRINNRV